jgi:hypothetical protein
VNILWISVAGGLIMFTILIVQLASWWLFVASKAPLPQADSPLYLVAPEANDRISPPRLEAIDRMTVLTTGGLWTADRLSQQQQQLSSYGWVDRELGIVHIPIDRAIKTVVEQGLLPAGPASGANDLDQIPTSANSGRSRLGERP